ncbi:MAG: hypothetical protein HZB39_06375 [Planctomycetes bacterium]|nr:hypothetical protein [Planctomycetota bacterium]
MQSHVVLEIEEEQLVATIADLTRRNATIRSCRRVAIDKPGEEDLAKAFRTVLEGENLANAEIHVVLSDRRFQHFHLDLPRVPARQLREIVEREARRRGKLAAEEEVICGHRLTRRLPQGMQRYAVVALPAAAFRPIERALARRDAKATTLTSLPDALARALPRGLPDRVLVLEITGSKAHIAFCEDAAAVQVRRILLPPVLASGEGPLEPIVSHLALEMPRTLDYLESQKLGRPEAMVVGHVMRLPDEYLRMVAADVGDCVPYTTPYAVPEGCPEPGMATYGVLQAEVRRQRFSLIGEWQTPASRRLKRVAGVIVGGTVACAVWGATELSLDEAALRAKRDELRSHTATLVERGTQEAGPTPVPAGEVAAGSSADLESLAVIFAQRKPISLLVAAACNALPEAGRFTRMHIESEGAIELAGSIDIADRIEALRALASVVDRLGSIAFTTDWSETVAERRDGLTFEVRGGWRLQ